MMGIQRPKIGLALSIGGPRGFAHIGVIKVLERNGIPIDFIAGSSAGALVGGFYAAFGNIRRVEKLALATDDWRQFFGIRDLVVGSGLLAGKTIRKFLKEHLDGLQFRDLKIPLTVVATDLRKGKAVYFNRGRLVPALRASVSLPLVFEPVKHGKELLLDGGLSLPVPVSAVKEMGADIVVAVNVKSYHFQEKGSNRFALYRIATNSLGVMRSCLADLSSQGADLVIVPKIANRLSWGKFSGREIIQAGEEAMEFSLSRLKELIRLKSEN